MRNPSQRDLAAQGRRQGSGAAVGLPGFLWDARAGRYRDAASGRFVAQSEIINLLRTVTDRAADRMGALGRLAAAGQITPRQFYEAMVIQVRQTTNAAAALAVGGWDRVTPAAWGQNGQQLRMEYERLRDFARALAAQELSTAQAVARAQLYADTAYGRYWQVNHMEQDKRGLLRARLHTVGDERVCLDCQAEAGRGWRPLPEVRVPPLHAGCRCEVRYD